MTYNLRGHIPWDYAAMQAGQDDEEEVFQDSFQFQLPPVPTLPVSSQVQTSSTPSLGPQTSSGAPQNDVATLTAAIASVGAENEALEWVGGVTITGWATQCEVSECPIAEAN